MNQDQEWIQTIELHINNYDKQEWNILQWLKNFSAYKNKENLPEEQINSMEMTWTKE